MASDYKKIPKFRYRTEPVAPTVFAEWLSTEEVMAKQQYQIDALIDNEELQQEAIENKQDKLTAGSGIDITNNVISLDSNIPTREEVNAKQDQLVNQVNIKSVNNQTLLGEGNITISADYLEGSGINISNRAINVAVDNTTIQVGTDNKLKVVGKQDTLQSGVNIKTINGDSVLGAGNLVVTGGSAFSAGTGIEIDENAVISVNEDVALVDDLATVAMSGLYSDLTGVPVDATTSTSGLMSSTDKVKLNGIAEGATANVGTITGITMNGASKGTSGVVDLGTVLTDTSSIAKLGDDNTFTGDNTFNGDVSITGTLDATVATTEKANKINTQVAIGSNNVPVYVANTGTVTKCANFDASVVTTGIFTRTGGTSTSAVTAQIQKYGRIYILTCRVKTDAGEQYETVAGANVWTGTIASAYRPPYNVEAAAYYGSGMVGLRIEPNGDVTFRNASASSQIYSGGAYFTAVYFI